MFSHMMSARRALRSRARLLMPSTAPSPWNMKKPQLLAELQERGVVVHSSWTVPELRQILIEQRDLEKPPATNDKMKGLTSLKLHKLVEMAEKEGITLPAKPTRGLMIKLIRDRRSAPAQTAVPFGRFKGYMYQEIPEGYLKWAIQETKGNPNSHEDLVRLATWAKEDLQRCKEAGVVTSKAELGRDPEALALIPPPSANSAAASSDGSWHLMRAPLKKGAAEMTESDIVEEEEDASEQIRALENQIAALKQRQSKS